MKIFRYIPIIILSLVSIQSFGQMAISFEEAKNQGINVADLDSTYKSGIHSDPNLAVFSEQQTEYIQAYYAMIRDLSTYLNSNDFRWGGQTRCFNRIYFAADGSIEYFIYQFEEGELSVERQAEFDQLLNEFINSAKFPMSKDVKFAQCSPVNYRDTL
jgi:hypothetical protein